MKKHILVILAVVMAVALISTVGLLVIPEKEDTRSIAGHTNHIYSILYNAISELDSPENATESVRLQQCLTALHAKCEDLSVLADFSYPADASFRHLADRIAQGAYRQEELAEMCADFAQLRDQLSSDGGLDRLVESYEELSRLLTDFLEKWVRSNAAA